MNVAGTARWSYVRRYAPSPAAAEPVAGSSRIPPRGNGFRDANRVYAEGRILFLGRYTGRLGASWERRDYEVGAKASLSLLRIEPASSSAVAVSRSSQPEARSG